LPASNPLSPATAGIAALFAASKNAESSASATTQTYAIHRSPASPTNRKPSAAAALSKSDAKSTARRGQRSTSAPATGASTANGAKRSTTSTASASADAPVTARTSPSTAMKLNQLPSSETTCPAHSSLNGRLPRSNCL
jgi:hypothetical protein